MAAIPSITARLGIEHGGLWRDAGQVQVPVHRGLLDNGPLLLCGELLLYLADAQGGLGRGGVAVLERGLPVKLRVVMASVVVKSAGTLSRPLRRG